MVILSGMAYNKMVAQAPTCHFPKFLIMSYSRGPLANIASRPTSIHVALHLVADATPMHDIRVAAEPWPAVPAVLHAGSERRVQNVLYDDKNAIAKYRADDV